MNEIKVARWYFFLILFLFLTLACVAIDCLNKVPRRDVMLLVLHNVALPALITVVLYVRDWIREK